MNSPRVIEIQASDTIEQAAAKIDLKPRALIMVLGDFEPALHPQVRSICSRSIVPLAVNPGALIIVNGAGSGCAAAVGEAVQDADEPPPTLAIVANDVRDPDPKHPLVLRLPAEWPDSLKAMLQIAAQLAKDETGREKPVVAVLFGGSDSHKAALIRCARRGWPVLLIVGTGGLADRIAKAMETPADGSTPPPSADPELREIIDTASLESFRIDGSIDDLTRLLLARIELRADSLADAWARYDDLDQSAVIKQATFKLMQRAILALAVLATLLAIISQGGAGLAPWRFLGPLRASLSPHLTGYRDIVHVFVVLAPIVLSVLVACSHRFREGNKWILLRAAAEAIKREIFRYRAQAGPYSDEQCKLTSRESKLAAKIKDFTSALAQSEANKTSLPRKEKNEPERLKFLSPEEYVKDRVEEQIGYLASKTESLYKQLKKTQIWVYIVGGVGTFLAAVRGDVWVALTTAIAAALTTQLETEQVENSLVQYNQALISLRNIESWWKALSQWERGRRNNINLLVEQTEKTLEGELAGWVQQMQTALDKLTEKEAESSQKDQQDEHH